MAALSIVSITTGATSGSLTGAADWRLYGPSDNTKSGGGGTISGLSVSGSGTISRYTGDPYTIPYTGGASPASGTWDGNAYNALNDGPPFSQTGSGLEFTLPADTSSRRARIDLSAYEAVLAIEFHLSDSSAADVSDTSSVSATVGNVMTAVVTVDYAAASAGQTLRVRVLVNTANGISANSAVFAAQWKLNAGPPAYALPYDAAAYSLTGAAETFKATRALPVTAASYALSASAISLGAGRKLAVDATSYAVTAAAEGLVATRSLNVDAASYALNAANVTLTYTPVAVGLAVDPASYALTTSAQGLVVARALNVDPASYALGAVDVDLVYGSLNKSLDIAPASYSLSATDVALGYSGASRTSGGSGGGGAKKRKREFKYDYSSPPQPVVVVEQAAKPVRVVKPKKAVPDDMAEMLALLESAQSVTAQLIAEQAQAEAEKAQQEEEFEMVAVIAMAL